MKLNSNIKILGNKIILVPYCKHHVPRYHEWMKSEELQALTASEPLTLEEEYEMQESWRVDEDKCTFIILDKNIYSNSNNECEAMVGDTNIFISKEGSKCIGEIEIMIAEKEFRGKKYGWEAVILMLLYGLIYIQIDVYEVKITKSNDASIKMFKKLGFANKSFSEVFQEVTLEKDKDDTWIKWLKDQVKFEIKCY